MADHAIDFSLGTEGRFYFVYRDGKEVKIETSPNLWKDLNENFRGGSIRQIQFGVTGTVWGIKSYRQYRDGASRFGGHTPGDNTLGLGMNPFDDNNEKNDLGLRRTRSASPSSSELPYTVQEEPFGSVPDSLMQKSAEIYPGMQHYGQVDFVAVGMGGAWVIGVMGKLCFWDKLEGNIVKKIAAVYSSGESLRNVALSPVRSDIYLLEAKDGTVQYHVPDDWHAQIKQHFHASNALDLDHPGFHPHPHPHHRSQPKHVATAAGGSRLNSSSGFNSGSGFSENNIGGNQYMQAPPAYIPYVPPPNYHSVDPRAVYATNAPSSGVIQAGGSDMKKEILIAMVKSTPAVLNGVVALAGLGGGGGGCTIM